MEDLVTETDKRISVHEAICAERYKAIIDSLEAGKDRMRKIEYLLVALAGVVMMGPGFAAELLKRLFGA